MKFYSELAELARPVGCADAISDARQQEKLLLEQTYTNVVITGGRGSGKTRLINRLVGLEVWEEGHMDEEEKPLRVAFEPLAEDARCNCLIAANHQWHDESAVLYELREDLLLSGGLHSDWLKNMDVVLMLISARAPFNADQINLLRALAPLRRYVVLTGLETIDEKDREQVLAYVNQFIDALKLPPIIVWREDSSEDLGRKVRNLLPAYDALQQLRALHVEYNRKKLAADIREKATAMLEENSANWEAAIASQAQAAAADRRESREWIGMLNELREMHLHALDTIPAPLERDCDQITRKMIAAASDAGSMAQWRKQIPEMLNVELSALVNQYAMAVERAYRKDIYTLTDSAKALGLHSFQQEEFLRLLDFEVVTDTSPWQSVPFTAANSSKKSDKLKLLIEMGAAACLCSVATMPVGLLGVVGTVGVGAVYYKKLSDEAAFENLETGMKEFQSILNRKIVEGLDSLYKQAQQILGDKARSCRAGSLGGVTDSGLQTLEDQGEALKKLIRYCDNV